MRSVRAAILSAVVAAGVTYYPARPSPHVLLASSRDTAVNNRTVSSFFTTFGGTVASINWTQIVAGEDGEDGIGAGNDVFRVSVLVDGDPVCYLDVACDATINTDYVTDCDETAVFVMGQDVDVRITSMPCAVAPAGFHTTDLIQH